MTVAQRATAAEKQAASKKLVTLLKKRYRVKKAEADRSVLDTLLYAICLENSPPAKAEAALERLVASFHDLNEMRVSSISELSGPLSQLEQPELRALRVKTGLQFVFEKQFAFDFEVLRKKTLDQAVRQLQKIKDLSPFVRSYTLQHSHGSHLVPLDDLMTRAAQWLGLVEPTETAEQASESIKSVIRKADSELFCQMLRALATDPDCRRAFESDVRNPPEGGFDPLTAPERLTQLFRQPRRKAASKKSATRQLPKRTTSKKKAAAKSRSAPARKTVAKKK
jgi:endonuclease-3